VLRGAEMRSTAERLEATTAAAVKAGVRDVPAILVGTHVFEGEDALERAAGRLRIDTIDRSPRDAGYELRIEQTGSRST
jgi:2-hydroxychromene-2-carboxylate isomerase